MKVSLIIVLLTGLIALGCEKDKYESKGTITGADMAMCICCGGYLIDIDGARYRFDKSKLPGNFTFNDNQLPLVVELDWDQDATTCKDFNWIKISRIKAQ